MARLTVNLRTQFASGLLITNFDTRPPGYRWQAEAAEVCSLAMHSPAPFAAYVRRGPDQVGRFYIAETPTLSVATALASCLPLGGWRVTRRR